MFGSRSLKNSPTPQIYKIIVSFFLVLGTTAITDLTRSYEKYKKQLDERKKSAKSTGLDIDL